MWLRQAAQPYIRYTTHSLPHRTATARHIRRTATTRFSPERVGYQKQTAPCLANNLIRWAFTSYEFTRWRHLSTQPINMPTTALEIDVLQPKTLFGALWRVSDKTVRRNAAPKSCEDVEPLQPLRTTSVNVLICSSFCSVNSRIFTTKQT